MVKHIDGWCSYSMAKTELTKKMEKELWCFTHKMGVFGAFEVTVGWCGKERVDYMTYDTKGILKCYEIKSSKADFHSKCKHSFLGHYNYYLLTKELYEEVKNEVPNYVGIYIYKEGRIESVKKSKRQKEVDVENLKSYLIRSLSRESSKILDSCDESLIERKNRYISQIERKLKNSRQELNDLRKTVYEKLGRNWTQENL